MRASRVRILLLAVSFLLPGASIGHAGPDIVALKYIVRAEMAVQPNGLAIDARRRIWLTLQGSPPSLGMVDATACAWRAECEPAEFPLPDEDAVPEFVTVDRHDKVWLTARRDGGGRLYKFDSETETSVTYATPGSKPYDIVVDRRGIVWFTDWSEGTVNSLHAGVVTEEYRTPAASLNWSHTGALGIAVDSSDAVWCACGTDLVRIWKTVTKIPAAGRQVDVYPIPDASIPHGVVAETSTRIWIMDQGWNWKAGRLIRFTRGCDRCLVPVDTFDGWPLPAFVEDGVGVIVDPHWLVLRTGTVHFTGFAGVVGTFDTRRETFGPYVVSPGRDVATTSGAYDIAIDPGGRVWFTEVNTPALSRVERFLVRMSRD
jgi:streptogramin lyase